MASFSLSPFVEYSEVNLRAEALRYGVALTEEVAIKKEMTVPQLKQLLSSHGQTHLHKLKAAELRSKAQSLGLSTITIRVITKARSREELARQLKKKFLCVKHQTEPETHRDKAIRLWTRIVKIIGALEHGKPNDPILRQWNSHSEALCKDWLQLHTVKTFRVYLHVLVCHGPQLHKTWGALSRYCQQGVEGAHKTQTSYFGRVKKSEKPSTAEERRNIKYEKMVHSYALVVLEPFMEVTLEKLEQQRKLKQQNFAK
jgi:hypothetical protein